MMSIPLHASRTTEESLISPSIKFILSLTSCNLLAEPLELLSKTVTL